MAQYVIGINGGASHSRLAAMDKEGNIIGQSFGKATNITSETYEGVALNIQNLLDELFTSSGLELKDCAAMCIGSAGASTGDNAGQLEQILRKLGYNGKLRIMNDAELVLLSETGGCAGAIIISGTGSVGYAIDNDGGIFRAGGWGHIIDDGGSGYRIGMDAIGAALMDFDGRGERTRLTKIVSEFFDGISLDKLADYVYSDEFNKAYIAKLARLVESAAKEGDNIALEIEQKAASDLASVARALIKRAGLSKHKIVLSGSIILRNENVQRLFCEGLLKDFPEIEIVEMAEDAEIGAARLAWEI